jgi:hypothetical protein
MNPTTPRSYLFDLSNAHIIQVKGTCNKCGCTSFDVRWTEGIVGINSGYLYAICQQCKCHYVVKSYQQLIDLKEKFGFILEQQKSLMTHHRIAKTAITREALQHLLNLDVPIIQLDYDSMTDTIRIMLEHSSLDEVKIGNELPFILPRITQDQKHFIWPWQTIPLDKEQLDIITKQAELDKTIKWSIKQDPDSFDAPQD